MALDKANIVEQLSNATVIEIADLVKELESKWGVSAAAAVAAAIDGQRGAIEQEERGRAEFGTAQRCVIAGLGQHDRAAVDRVRERDRVAIPGGIECVAQGRAAIARAGGSGCPCHAEGIAGR